MEAELYLRYIPKRFQRIFSRLHEKKKVVITTTNLFVNLKKNLIP